MAINGQQFLNIGTENAPTGSDSLFQAFGKVQNNFTNLFSYASPFSTFSSGNGIQINANSTSNTITITNTGVTSLIPGTGITLSGSNGNVTISAGGSGASGVTRVGVVSDGGTIHVVGGPIVSTGNINIDLPNIPTGPNFAVGTYVAPTLKVDAQGRITEIANTTGVGTVTSIAIESADQNLQITGSPVTSNGTITIQNMGVTSITNGGGLSISGSTGDITIAATNRNQGTVTSVTLHSNTLTITGSPVTTSGPLTVDIPSDVGNIGASGNANFGYVRANVLQVTGNVTIGGNLTVTGNTYTINANNVAYTGGIINLNTPANLAPLTSDNGINVGLSMHYYDDNDNHAFVGRLGTGSHSGALAYYATSTDPESGPVSGLTLGDIVANNFIGNATYAAQANIANIANTVAGANVTGQVGNALVATTSVHVTASAQPNITSVGNLTSLIVGNTIANSTFSNGNLNVTTSITSYDMFTSNSFTITGTSDLIFNTSANAQRFVALAAPTSISALYIAWALPNTAGTVGQFLTTDGAGNMQWSNSIASSSAPSTASSAGTTGQIAFDSTHIYVCIATNSWIRASAAAW